MVPLAVIIGTCAAGGARWDIAAVLIAFLSCVPFFLAFDSRAPKAREVVLVSVMTAFSAAGRVAFAVVPFFKPVTAIVVMAAMYFGPYAGFMTGAMSALISNIYFGQGAWTPFQMLCWGMVGFAAGLLNRKGLLESPLWLSVYGALAGAVYSVMMDVWTVLSADGVLNMERFLAVVLAGLPVMVTYCVSNVVFLLVLRRPLGGTLRRLKEKYGVFCEDE